MRALKIILLILFLLVITGALLVTCTGAVLIKGVEKAVEQATTVEGQTISHSVTADLNTVSAENIRQSQGEITITVPLIVKKEALLRGVELCGGSESIGKAQGYQGHSSACMQNQCETRLSFSNEIPSGVTIERKYLGKCVAQPIDPIAPYLVNRYEGELALERSMLDQLHVPQDQQTTITKTPESHYQNSGMLALGNRIKFTLEYGKNPPSEDQFRLGDLLVRVKYRSTAEKLTPQSKYEKSHQPSTQAGQNHYSNHPLHALHSAAAHRS